MQIVFLCGGLGTRLNAINANKPKGLININGIPFFDYVIDSLINYQPTSLHFCLGYKSEMYIEYLKKFSERIKITYSLESPDNLLGTGGAIKNAFNFLEENFIVQYGDTILKLDYRKFFQFHLSNNKKMTMSIIHKSLTDELPNLFCKKDKLDSINCIYNKKNPSKEYNYIDYGAIAFKKAVFEEQKNLKFDLSEIQEKFSENFESAFIEIENKYIEIGTPDSLKKASSLLFV